MIIITKVTSYFAPDSKLNIEHRLTYCIFTSTLGNLGALGVPQMKTEARGLVIDLVPDTQGVKWEIRHNPLSVRL